jgi:hypothetical protein
VTNFEIPQRKINMKKQPFKFLPMLLVFVFIAALVAFVPIVARARSDTQFSIVAPEWVAYRQRLAYAHGDREPAQVQICGSDAADFPGQANRQIPGHRFVLRHQPRGESRIYGYEGMALS